MCVQDQHPITKIKTQIIKESNFVKFMIPPITNLNTIFTTEEGSTKLIFYQSIPFSIAKNGIPAGYGLLFSFFRVCLIEIDILYSFI